MLSSLTARWKEDTARNTFIYTNFVVGLPFSIFSTYVVYQLQITGFLIGADSDGLPCTTYCIVPFGGQHLDLNSVLLYMNAMTFGFGGFITLLIIAYADFWKYKSLLVPSFIVVYGILAIPVYWLTAPTLTNLYALIALYVAFGVVTSIFIALLSIYVPHCMRTASHGESTSILSNPAAIENADKNSAAKRARRYGFAMSVFGMVASSVAAIVILAIVAGLSGTLTGTSGQNAGLLVTTIIGCITVVASIGSFLGLPALPVKPAPETGLWKSAVKELFTPLKLLWVRKNMLFMLLAYTIYTDTSFATSSIISQLYFVQIIPSTLEFSLYSLATNVFNLICLVAFFILHRKFNFNLEKCMIFGYAWVLIVPVWGIIGISDQNNFGDKHRWEFYVQTLALFISYSIVNPVFRLLYAEMIPKGEEVLWFGLQLVLSCATTWVAYVATGPLQNATHDLRFPLILCLIFFFIPLALECTRYWQPYFKRDKARWQETALADLEDIPNREIICKENDMLKTESKTGTIVSNYVPKS